MKIIHAVVVFAALAFPSAAFAGWGAIAYNSATGAMSEAHGYSSQYTAESVALKLCGAGCTIVNWEHNSCIALATNSAGGWGEAHGYSSEAAVRAAAISFCGNNCIWREWACE
jgi:Domain of unknown function (DUF4189)